MGRPAVPGLEPVRVTRAALVLTVAALALAKPGGAGHQGGGVVACV